MDLIASSQINIIVRTKVRLLAVNGQTNCYGTLYVQEINGSQQLHALFCSQVLDITFNEKTSHKLKNEIITILYLTYDLYITHQANISIFVALKLEFDYSPSPSLNYNYYCQQLTFSTSELCNLDYQMYYVIFYYNNLVTRNVIQSRPTIQHYNK